MRASNEGRASGQGQAKSRAGSEFLLENALLQLPRQIHALLEFTAGMLHGQCTPCPPEEEQDPSDSQQD